MREVFLRPALGPRFSFTDPGVAAERYDFGSKPTLSCLQLVSQLPGTFFSFIYSFKFKSKIRRRLETLNAIF